MTGSIRIRDRRSLRRGASVLLVALAVTMAMAGCTAVGSVVGGFPDGVIQVPGSITIPTQLGYPYGPRGTVIVCTDTESVLSFRTDIAAVASMQWNNLDGTSVDPSVFEFNSSLGGSFTQYQTPEPVKPGCGTLNIGQAYDGGPTPPGGFAVTLTLWVTKVSPS